MQFLGQSFAQFIKLGAYRFVKLFLRRRVRTKDTQHTMPELNPFFVAGTRVRSADKHLDARKTAKVSKSRYIATIIRRVRCEK